MAISPINVGSPVGISNLDSSDFADDFVFDFGDDFVPFPTGNPNPVPIDFSGPSDDSTFSADPGQGPGAM